jgi:hypothetical protein
MIFQIFFKIAIGTYDSRRTSRLAPTYLRKKPFISGDRGDYLRGCPDVFATWFS